MRRSLTFELRGVKGHVRIDYDTNDDPARWGFDLLGLDFDVQVARGFPVVQARVEYPAEGYLGCLGWIQVVAYTVIHGAERSTTELVDLAPQLRAAGIPYLSFGLEPALFDAPAFTERDVDWAALSFLTASPDLLMTQRSSLYSASPGATRFATAQSRRRHSELASATTGRTPSAY